MEEELLHCPLHGVAGRHTTEQVGEAWRKLRVSAEGLLWFSLLQPRACVRGIKLGRQAANTLWRLVLPA